MADISPFDLYANEYDVWFDQHTDMYQAELNALRQLVPDHGCGLEVGVGTGRFSNPLGIRVGVDPSLAMLQIAKSKDLFAINAVGEYLPFKDCQFDYAVMVTVLCFVDDALKLLTEVKRVVKDRGKIITAFIDRNSELGRLYDLNKDKDRFFMNAKFYSALEIAEYYNGIGLSGIEYVQTIIGLPDSNTGSLGIFKGYGKGAFVVISGMK